MITGVWHFFRILIFYASSISNQSFADASSSNITRLPIPMPMEGQEQEG
jgi:hypothetical protein